MEFIDTHAHIYLEEFDEDRKEIISRTQDLQTSMIFMPNIDSSSIDAVHQTEVDYPGVCHAMMGLHPCYVKDNYQDELDLVEKWLSKRKYAAVGEIGIDLYWDKTTLEIQKLAFEKQISWAKDLGIPIVIHSRDSLDITIDIVSEMQDGNLKGIFHCFNGTVEQGKKIADVGFYIGIGGVTTFKKAGVDKTVAQLNLTNMVLETDAPYLSPTPHRGKRNSPEHIAIIAEKLSEIQQVSLIEVASKTTENAKKLFHQYLS